LQDIPKFTLIFGTFGLKIYHLATLVSGDHCTSEPRKNAWEAEHESHLRRRQQKISSKQISFQKCFCFFTTPTTVFTFPQKALFSGYAHQCCQMVDFQTKVPIWVNFGRSCNGRWWYFCGNFVYFTAKWYFLLPLGTFLVIFPWFGMLYREKSGNPDVHTALYFTTSCCLKAYPKIITHPLAEPFPTTTTSKVSSQRFFFYTASMLLESDL
jgi:hypothetical protein